MTNQELNPISNTDEINNTIYDITLKKLKEKLSNITIRPSTLYLVIKYAMVCVEETPIKGTDKKQLAHNLIHAIIVDFTEGEDEKVLLQLLKDNTIDNIIDLIVDATKGKLDINNVANVSVGCFTRCMPYLC